jgi:alpha-ketoglutarate-dependent taurine dioxygenase
VNLPEWARQHRGELDTLVTLHGAILFRGFSISGVDEFEQVTDAAVDGNWVEYREAATPRSSVTAHISTSTEYPASLRIYVHNENSHVTSWPLYLFFYCCIPAKAGGATPLADCRAIRQRLPPSVVSAFEQKGWLYRRNFLTTSSTPWTKVFGTNQEKDVADYCRANYMTPEWNERGLTVTYRRWATLPHPKTGDLLWFNHGTFFNRHTLDPALRHALRSVSDERLASNTYFGDGTPIGDDVMTALDDAYTSETIRFAWNAGDILMVDNMRLAHGRESYIGAREVYVAMKQQIHCSQIAAPHQYSPPEPPHGLACAGVSGG